MSTTDDDGAAEDKARAIGHPVGGVTEAMFEAAGRVLLDRHEPGSMVVRPSVLRAALEAAFAALPIPDDVNCFKLGGCIMVLRDAGVDVFDDNARNSLLHHCPTVDDAKRWIESRRASPPAWYYEGLQYGEP